MRMSKFLVISFVMLSISTGSAETKELKNGEYVLAPGTDVMIGRPPKGTKLDELGCFLSNKTNYRCYAGMLAGQQFTSKEEAIAAWRIIMNPGSATSQNAKSEALKAGRGYQVGVK